MKNVELLNKLFLGVCVVAIALCTSAIILPETDAFHGKQAILVGAISLASLLLIALAPARHKPYATYSLLAITIAVSISGFWFTEGLLGISDWDYYFSLHESYRTSLLHYGQFPLWNPYICGGTAALADPEFSVFTITFPLELVFGVSKGLRLAIYLATIVGAGGLLTLARELKLSHAAAFLAAIIYALSSVNLLEIVEGHVNIFSAMWLPWIYWAWYRAYLKKNSPLLCGIFLSLTFYQGGIYLLMYVGSSFLLLPFLTGQKIHAWKITIKAGAWSLGLAALKLVPVMLWLKEFPDKAYASSSFTLTSLHHVLLGRHLHGAEIIPNQSSGWHEYGAYVGLTALLLALLGASGYHQRIIRALVLAALLGVIISSSGPTIKPIFDQAPFLPRSNISRIIVVTVISLSLLAGFGLDRWRKMGGALLTYALLVIVVIDIGSLSYQLSRQAFVLPDVIDKPAPAAYPLEFTAHRYLAHHQGDDYARAYAATRAGYGTLTYCSVLGPASQVRTIHDEGPVEYAALHHKSGTISNITWTPNRVIVEGHADEPGDVIINTNYAHGWTQNNIPALDVEGRVAAPVAAGDFKLAFTYFTPGLLAGAIITIIVATAALAVTFRKKIIQ